MSETMRGLQSDTADYALHSAQSHATNMIWIDNIIAELSQRSTPSVAATVVTTTATTDLLDSTEVSDQFRRVNASLARLGKSVDKKFATPVSSLFPPTTTPTATTSTSLLPTPEPTCFSSPEAITALNKTIALHLARSGAFNALNVFLEESGTEPIESNLSEALATLYAIVDELKLGHCSRALEWITSFGSLVTQDEEMDDLLFLLRQTEFISILLKDDDSLSSSAGSSSTGAKPNTTHIEAALVYGGTHFPRFMTPSRQPLINALLTSTLFTPLARLVDSPYASLYAPYHSSSTASTLAPATNAAMTKVIAAFSNVYLATLGIAKESPLKVVTDIGGGGALARILKVRTVMKEKKTEWSAIGELPVEIPVPPHYRYHSVFACPVSKEQTTPSNPPMLLPCGHVLATESLIRLTRGSHQLKCPYCPIVSQLDAVIRVHF